LAEFDTRFSWTLATNPTAQTDSKGYVSVGIMVIRLKIGQKQRKRERERDLVFLPPNELIAQNLI